MANTRYRAPNDLMIRRQIKVYASHLRNFFHAECECNQDGRRCQRIVRRYCSWGSSTLIRIKRRMPIARLCASTQTRLRHGSSLDTYCGARGNWITPRMGTARHSSFTKRRAPWPRPAWSDRQRGSGCQKYTLRTGPGQRILVCDPLAIHC
jgi:hypothetical protein